MVHAGHPQASAHARSRESVKARAKVQIYQDLQEVV